MGGASREREISYAGGRTVYDLLDRRRFAPVPIFLDAFHRMVRLQTAYLYYGMIPDFFPAPDSVPPDIRFPLYAEQLHYPESSAYMHNLTRLGPILPPETLAREIDIAFLVLHGLGGEDGSIQGLLEQLGIPYVGSGIGASAWGMDKIRQRTWLEAHGFPVPSWYAFPRRWLWEEPHRILEEVAEKVGFPCIIKHPLQGSTIGVSYCLDEKSFWASVYRCAFTFPVKHIPETLDGKFFHLVEGLGLPLLYRTRTGEIGELITDLQELQHFLRRKPHQGFLEAWDAPEYLLCEQYIQGAEFSVIVLELPDGEKVALPPTHIRKAASLYDYRAKYLSGISSKQTPSPNLPNDLIQQEAERLADLAGIQVYARLDGIVSDNQVFFNDPNTTSGMLPASLLFHQAAEVGFTPTGFLTYLIQKSLATARTGSMQGFLRKNRLLLQHKTTQRPVSLRRIAVIFGGISSERHISLESGRNVVEKLTVKYEVLPLFLHVTREGLHLWELPPRLLFKDNADDVAATLASTEMPKVVEKTRSRLSSQLKEHELHPSYTAHRIEWEELKERVDFVFLALHGRPGEDGTLQRKLEELGLPYNGSSPKPCALMMDKAATYAFLAERGFHVPKYYQVAQSFWETHSEVVLDHIEATLGSYPYIGKPVDEGCSTGVRILPNRHTLRSYLQGLLRRESSLSPEIASVLNIRPNEPFPPKPEALIETYLQGEDWIEITVGVITHTSADGRITYQAFLPSETIKGDAILSLEEKFLAGAGQNLTPARIYPENTEWNHQAIAHIQSQVQAIAEAIGIHGYARIDGFARRLGEGQVEFWVLEINALPGLTPATVFFHQALKVGYTPLQILEHIVEEGYRKWRLRR